MTASTILCATRVWRCSPVKALRSCQQASSKLEARGLLQPSLRRSFTSSRTWQTAAVGGYLESYLSSRGAENYSKTIENLGWGGKEGTEVIVQGFTGKASTFHSKVAIDMGTNIVGGTSPGKGGQTHLDRPVFNTMREAMENLETRPKASMVFVPPTLAAQAIIESVEAEIPLVVSVAEGIPLHDQLKVMSVLRSQSKSRLVGGNSPGMISPVGKFKLGIMPAAVHRPGRVGVASRSGTLSYECASQITEVGLGQSYVLGLGGDPYPGTRTWEALKFLLNDPNTDAIVLCGEIGGPMEEEAAEYLQSLPASSKTKPVVGYIAGTGTLSGRVYGHAGASYDAGVHSAEEKRTLWEKAGISLAPTMGDIGKMAKQALETQKL